MRNRSYFLFAFFIVTIVFLNFFATGSAETTFIEKGQRNEEVEKLLKERIDIINDYLFNNMDFLDLERRLSSIEGEELLKEDIEILKGVENNPTDFPLVKDFSIEDMILLRKWDNNLEYKILVNWHISYSENEAKEKDYYRVNLVNINNKLYLTKFEQIKTYKE